MDIVSAMDFPFWIDVHLSGPNSPTYLVWVKSELFILIPATEKKNVFVFERFPSIPIPESTWLEGDYFIISYQIIDYFLQ